MFTIAETHSCVHLVLVSTLGKAVLLKHWPCFFSDGCRGQKFLTLKHILPLWAVDTYLRRSAYLSHDSAYLSAEGRLSPWHMHTVPYWILCPVWDPQGISCVPEYLGVSPQNYLATYFQCTSCPGKCSARDWNSNLQSPLLPSQEQNGRTETQ